MNIVGIGTDIAECSRIAKMVERHGELFLERVFTSREIDYCQTHKNAVERFAGRWAAKEAILKSLGTGWQKGISWLDMEVVNDVAGKPIVHLGGAAAQHAVRQNIDDILISISHCRTYAVGFAIATGRPVESTPPPPETS
ncbi:Holo-[acyl-carrier-protein] synthase [Planctomycetes bacterium Pan216]|uniref:Holo-[acyl-carrier-protein] synthase n=1 Tax=Kolteria novifilia TaxID=2527975 RepID=A0A518B8R6_9BACT|nr:Holo-[acyl-carrier-protein] synthase [Planctomycetes bacterium Pan216]